MSSRSPTGKSRSKSKGNGALRLQVGGTLIPGKHLYIERPADQELFDLLRQGEYCNILTSRQMGKSSLMARTYKRLAAEGHHVVIADMGLIGSLVSSDQWYRGLLETMVRRLGLPVDVEEWWQAAREATPELRLLRFFREEVAAKVPGDKPIILFVDEIDGTLDLPFSDDFFLAMRAMYNQRALTPEYERIVFCPVGVASPNELIKDKRKTPYNIGKLIELRDFDPERGDDLSPLSRYVGGDDALREILRFTGGHPYLTTLICEKFVRERRRSADDVGPLIHQQFTSLEEALRDPHFNYIREFIRQRAEDPMVTLKLYRQILGNEPVKDQVTPAHMALKLAGLVKRGPRGTLVVRNEIYRRLFTEDWARRTAESETRDLVEREGWNTAARIHEDTLKAALDDYKVAFSHYQSLRDNPACDKRKADELWADYFDRRAERAEQAGHRDEAILWRLRAIETSRNEMRARAFQTLIASDYPRLELSFRHPKVGTIYHKIFPWDATQIVAFSPGGKRIVTAGLDATAQLWSAETGLPIGEPMRHNGRVRAVAFSPDGRCILTGSSDTTARLWSAETGALIGVSMRHEDKVLAVAFSPDGSRILTGSNDRTARLWSAETGAPIGEPMGHDGWVRAVAFNPDGHRVLTGSNDNTARLWNAESGEPISKPMRHESSVRAVAFSPQGRRVLTGSDDKTARLWNAETAAPIGEPMRHENDVRAVAFSPDGRRVLTGSQDNTARLWIAETGAPFGVLMRHENGVRAVAFSPDGHRILTGSDDTTARLWSIETGSDSDPIVGDPEQLLIEWQRRLGLKINDAGEIVPLWQ